MQPIATDVPWSLCLLDKLVSPAKLAESVEMPIGVWTHGAQGTKY